jgi:transcriptional regulator with XRE-family HTH domain
MAGDDAVGARLRDLRKGAGMTQKALAERMTAAGLSWYQSTVGRAETGRRRLVVSEEREIARILGVPPDWAVAA